MYERFFCSVRRLLLPLFCFAVAMSSFVIADFGSQQSQLPTIKVSAAEMPFLRSLDSVSMSQEVRSSKTLIGAGATICDVVIAGDNVLDLHALLNLSADKASAKLTPFSTSEAGVCYVNDVVVPIEGAVVVHGDRVAFGNPRNVFLFELTPHPQMTAVSSDTPLQSIKTENSKEQISINNNSTNANRAFRKALDTLRGDRKTSTPNASVIASIQSNTPAESNRTGVLPSAGSSPSTSKSKDQLSKFLLEASTDSLLSDYVERKLKQRISRPSPVSTSNQSETCRQSITSNSTRQSREYRNMAEVEKLRLSQRIREVNDVLNGDMDFQESYLSPSAKSSRNIKTHWVDDSIRPLGNAKIVHSVDGAGIDESEEDEDDLPSMIEKPANTLKSRIPPSTSVSIQTEHSDQATSSHLPNYKDTKEERGILEYSLESLAQAETNHLNHEQGSENESVDLPKARDFFSKAASLGLNDLTRSRSRPIKTERQAASKTALHEKLINQMIRLKQNEIMSQGFVRWKKGLQIQNQNRERKAHQLQEAKAALGILRRDQYFTRWHEFAATTSQVMICRLEAFQQRCEHRLMRTCWAVLHLHHFGAAHRLKLLRGLAIRKSTLTRHLAFRRWEKYTQKSSIRSELNELERVEQQKLDFHLERISDRHYYQWKLQPKLMQILRKWRAVAGLHKKRQRILRKVLAHGNAKLSRQAWRKWAEVVLLSRQQMSLNEQSQKHIQRLTERFHNQQEQAQSSLQENHANQVQKLMLMIEEKDQELEQFKREKRVETLEKAAAKAKLDQDLHRFFEKAIVKCDDQIAQASSQLEDLLHSAEDDVLAARFGAAQFLVESMLQQKVCNANEFIRLQQKFTPLSTNKPPKLNSGESLSENLLSDLSSNGRFLYSMIQQRLTRLQQLHQSLAKLAAVSDSSSSLDPERLRHSSFLVDALLQRQQRHLSSILKLFRRLEA